MKAASPNNLQDIREHFAILFESQSMTNLFANNVSELVRDVNSEMADGLREIILQLGNARITQAEQLDLADRLEGLIMCNTRLASARILLLEERQAQWKKNRKYLKQIMLEFDQISCKLGGTLIEKDLLERQSQVLEGIILSHGKMSQWDKFVQEILQRFHTMFPFDTFFMAFPEEEGLSLFIYHPKGSLQETKLLVRGKLIRELVEQLGLPSGILIDVDEFVIDTVSPLPVPIDDIETIMVPLKNREMCDWAGFIGVGYATAREALTLQEESVVRSILGVMVMVVGSSKALSRTLTELEYYSNHDPLTGLYNRRYFNEMLDYEVGRSECHKHEFSILMLDMDNFKDVNDTYGHPCGDVALKQMAETIHASMRKGDLATRIGGDEFAIILAETGKSGALAVAEKLRKQLREITFQSPEGKRFHVTTSIGLITYPEDAQNISDLMSGVDMGLYRAKEMGKDGICMLDSIEHIQAGRTTRDHAEKLRDALKGDRVVPYFQPIFDCRSKKIFAFETLARLVEPNGEIITAGMFIETIEKYGMGRELDRAVIEKSLSVMKRQIDLNGVSCRLFINLSAQEIQGRGVLGFAEQLCSTLEIPPKNVVFEILERDAISDMTHMRKFLSDLGRKGFSFALDDFGSGYNSFHYLRELHFDYVKIDGAFVRNILNSKIDYALVRNLSHLCQDIGILTIAEFVESDEILEALRDMGIDYAQGYHLGMPTSQLSNSPHALEPEHQRAAPGQTQAGVISGSATYR